MSFRNTKVCAQARKCIAAIIAGTAALFFSAGNAQALSFAPNSTYGMNGGLGLVLSAEGTGPDLWLGLQIAGTVTSSGLSGPASISQIAVNYTISTSDIRLFSNGTAGAVVGTVNGGAGFMTYHNAALVNGPTGQIAAVFTDDMNPNTPQNLNFAQGSGGGTLGAFGVTLQGQINGGNFSDSVNLDAKSQYLGGTVHEAAYAPLSTIGAFSASFGDLGGSASSFHGWVMSNILGVRGAAGSDGFFLTLGGVHYRVAGDFHGTLTPGTGGGEIPEPASLLLLSVAGAGLLQRRRSAKA